MTSSYQGSGVSSLSDFMGTRPDYTRAAISGQKDRRDYESAIMNTTAGLSADIIGAAGKVGISKEMARLIKARGSASTGSSGGFGLPEALSGGLNMLGGLFQTFNNGGGFSDSTVTGNKLPSFTRRNTSTNMITAN